MNVTMINFYTAMEIITQVGMVSKTDLKNNKSPFLHYVAMGIP